MAVNKALLCGWLLVDEALFLTVYDDATEKPLRPGMTLKGHPTIGIGRALDVHGITKSEALLLCSNDADEVIDQLSRALPWLTALDEVRSTVLADMAFNLGFAGLLAWHQTLSLIASGDYQTAADEMAASHWATEVGSRATRLIERMRTGQA
jgi:lysozyme